jgi:transcriptional regulator with XRE-family HTH domain
MLGDNLKTLRKEKKLSQTEISKIIGIAQTTYAGYENNKHEPDLRTLKKIADYYRVSVDYLIGRII